MMSTEMRLGLLGLNEKADFLPSLYNVVLK
jgi:hypothetical protein